MKFMQKSEDRLKEQIKKDTDMAITQIKQESAGFISAASKFGSKKLEVNPMETREISSEQVIEAARRVTGQSVKKVAEIDSKKNVQVTFAKDDLKGFSTEKKVLVKDQTGVAEQDLILKSLFVTNAEDALEEFEQEKDQAIEKDLGA